MGISNINQIEEGAQSNNILTANNLVDNGVRVWGFITPVLPYIMDVEEIIEALNKDIPVFLDKLMIEADTIQATNMKKFIRQHYPEYIDQYNKIIYENDERYFDELTGKYANNSRIKNSFSLEIKLFL
jgi:DNA repair photolyase